MNQEKLLELIYTLNQPFGLSKVIDIFKLLGLDEEYTSYESMRVSIIGGLNGLNEKGFIHVDRPRWRNYQITQEGMKESARCKLNSMITGEVLKKVL